MSAAVLVAPLSLARTRAPYGGPWSVRAMAWETGLSNRACNDGIWSVRALGAGCIGAGEGRGVASGSAEERFGPCWPTIACDGPESDSQQGKGRLVLHWRRGLKELGLD